MEWKTRFVEYDEREASDFEWVEYFSARGLTVSIKKCREPFKHKRNHDKLYRTHCQGASWRIQLGVPLPEGLIPENMENRKFCSDDFGACLEFVETIKKEAEKRWG